MADRQSSHDTTALLAAGAFLYLSLTLLSRNINNIVPLPVPRADGYWWTFRNVESEFIAMESSGGSAATDTAGGAEQSTTAIRMRDKNGRKLPTQDQIPLSVLETLVQSPVYDIRQAALAILATRYALHPRTPSNFRKSWTAEQSSWDDLEGRIRREEAARGEDTASRASPNLSPNSLSLDPNERQLAISVLYSLERPLRDHIRSHLPEIFAITRPAASNDDPTPSQLEAVPSSSDNTPSSASELEQLRLRRVAAYQRFFTAMDVNTQRPLTSEDYCQIIGWDAAGDMTDPLTSQPYRHDADPNPNEAYVTQAISTATSRLLERQDDAAAAGEPPSVFEGVESRRVTHTQHGRMIVIDRVGDAAAAASHSTATRLADAQQRESCRLETRALLVSLMGETLARRVAGRRGPSSPASVFFSRANTRSWRLPARDADEGERASNTDMPADGERLGRRVARAERSGADGRGSRAVSPRSARLWAGAVSTAAIATSASGLHRWDNQSLPARSEPRSEPRGGQSPIVIYREAPEGQPATVIYREDQDGQPNMIIYRAATRDGERDGDRPDDNNNQEQGRHDTQDQGEEAREEEDEGDEEDPYDDDDEYEGEEDEEDSDYYDREPCEQCGMPSPTESEHQGMEDRMEVSEELFRRREAMAILEVDEPPADPDVDMDGDPEYPPWWEDDIRHDYDYGVGRSRPLVTESTSPYDVPEEEFNEYYSL